MCVCVCVKDSLYKFDSFLFLLALLAWLSSNGKVYGGAGVSGDFPLARALAGLRSLRIADGPDAVHKRTVALIEIKKTQKKLQQNGTIPKSKL